MFLSVVAIIFGLALLVWSADRFVTGSAAVARHFGMPPLLIGMVIVGFGTSAPEMTVSAFAASQGNPAIALGNAYGSNIANITLILGLTALISPIAVKSSVLKKELPILIGATLIAFYLLWDNDLSRGNAWTLLLLFAGLMIWAVVQGVRQRDDNLGVEVQNELSAQTIPFNHALIWLLSGLIVLIISSRLLVWGAVEVAIRLGVSDLVVGLTIVAIGTSLPELASSLVAACKSEHDIALGNVIGSNLFNTLAVVGIAGAIHPTAVPAEVLQRDIPIMTGLTFLLFLFGYGFQRTGRINRFEGLLLFLGFIAYNSWVIFQAGSF